MRFLLKVEGGYGLGEGHLFENQWQAVSRISAKISGGSRMQHKQRFTYLARDVDHRFIQERN